MGHRYAAKVDDNQGDIVHDFRMMGCDVICTHGIGDGMTDLIVAISEINVLVEVKNGKKPPSQRRLTPDQELFHAGWRGWKEIVKDSFEVEKVVKKYRNFASKIQQAGIRLENPV